MTPLASLLGSTRQPFSQRHIHNCVATIEFNEELHEFRSKKITGLLSELGEQMYEIGDGAFRSVCSVQELCQPECGLDTLGIRGQCSMSSNVAADVT